jgi:hypothetical protein
MDRIVRDVMFNDGARLATDRSRLLVFDLKGRLCKCLHARLERKRAYMHSHVSPLNLW